MAEQAKTIVETENEKVSTPKNEFEGLSSNTREFNEVATARLNKDLANAVKLAAGENPSSKYLRQVIEAKGLPQQISKFLNEILGFMEFVDAGKGVEYVLTNMGTVTEMDPSAFVPSEVYEMSDATYVDTLDLPTIGSSKTKAVERSTALYKYVEYYLSGKAAQVADVIRSYMNDSMMLSVFNDLLTLLQRMYAVIQAKGDNTNHVTGTATNPLDAMKEFKDFVTNMLSYNTKYNWGIDDGKDHSDFTNAYNFAKVENLRFITDYRTYNNIKKILPTVFHDDKLAQDLLGNDSAWVIVPSSYLQVDSASTTLAGQPTLVEDFQLFETTNEKGDAARKLGTIMVIQKNDIKCAYNFEQNEAEYFPKNCVTQIFMKKNLAIKALKWAQVGVFENEHLEDAFVIPTTQIA